MIIRYGEDGMRLDKKGFSLIEIMVAIAIMSILSIAMMKTYTGFTRVYTTQEVAAGAQQDLRAALNIMTQDIRMAGFDPTDSDNFGVEVATATNIRITSDTDIDGVVDQSNFERITYNLNAGTNQLQQILYQGTASESTQPVVDNVTNLTFTYLDEDNNITATPADIRTVIISMTIQELAGRGGLVTRSLSTRVQCRNLGFQ
jgi:type II secretion system protein J